MLCFIIISNSGNGTKNKLVRTGIPEDPGFFNLFQSIIFDIRQNL